MCWSSSAGRGGSVISLGNPVNKICMLPEKSVRLARVSILTTKLSGGHRKQAHNRRLSFHPSTQIINNTNQLYHYAM